MIDVTTTTQPKSDQLNADSLIGGPKTIKVTKVSLLTEADQPIAIGFEGDNGKPYKPCKSMRRVMVNCWGPDGNAYIGRSMTIFRDDKVAFGGAAVGGIRISHMSNIDGPVTMALTATRASRKPFTVKPLAPTASPAPHDDPPPKDLMTEGIIVSGNMFAADGKAAFTKFWNSLSREHRDLAGGKVQRDLWLAIATKADEAPPTDDDLDLPSDFDDNEHSSLSTVTPAEQGQAAADARADVETAGAAGSFSGGGDGPAPDPQQDRPTGDGAADGAPDDRPDYGSQEPRKERPPSEGTSRQGPQTGVGASPTPIASTPATPAETAFLADVIARGNAAAAEGPAAILNFLGDLPRATKAMLPDGQILAWNRTADRRAASRDKGRSAAQP